MPKKLNSAGQMQNYVPAGNGDASGEYGDNATGSNKHFTTFKKPREKKTIKYQYNSFWNRWQPISEEAYNKYLKQKEMAERYGYHSKEEQFEDREITVLNEAETKEALEKVYNNMEKAIDNATIDNIQDFKYFNVFNNNILNVVNGTLSNYDLNDYEQEYFRKNNKLFTKEQEAKLEEKAKEKGEQLAETYIKDNFTKIKGEHTIEDDLKNVNPKYKESKYYQINCQRCSFAYELRRRGYNVEANPNKNNFGIYYKWFSQMSFKEKFSFKNNVGGKKVINKIIEKVKEAGNGSRWAVDVQWRRSTTGHLFIAENVNGEVKFFDAQNNRQDCSGYFDYLATTKETIIYRMDNAKFNYGVKETGFSPKGE